MGARIEAPERCGALRALIEADLEARDVDSARPRTFQRRR